MVKRDVKGLHKVRSKGRDYWYAWRGRGAARLRGKYGTPEFWASYDEAIRERQIPEPGRFRALVTLYRGSTDYQKLAASTQGIWSRWLDRIATQLGTLAIVQWDRPEKIRPIIRQWRNQWVAQPRTADLGMQVLSRVCSYAVDSLGKLASNPCLGIKTLYSNDRAEIIWTDGDIVTIKQLCSPEVAHAIDLAAATGLRRGDLLRLCWSHVRDDCIVISTGKSNHKREAIVPLYDGLNAVLARIPKRSTAVLTDGQGKPWIYGSFGVAFNTAKKDAGLQHLHFHDLRGTAATRFYLAGLPERAIGEILGWEEASVGHIIRKYVDRSAAVKDIIRKLNAKRT